MFRELNLGVMKQVMDAEAEVKKLSKRALENSYWHKKYKDARKRLKKLRLTSA